MCDSHPDAHRARLVKARLPHTCYSCGFTIARGEVYHYASGVWDGEAADFKRHQLCAVLEERSGEPDGCVDLGSLRNARDSDHHSWVFRRAWSVVMGVEWEPCEDCGDTLPYPSEATLCASCRSTPHEAQEAT